MLLLWLLLTAVDYVSSILILFMQATMFFPAFCINIEAMPKELFMYLFLQH